MELITKKDGSNVTIEITGWLDTQTAPQLGEELAKLDDSVTSLVFDFDKLEYISCRRCQSPSCQSAFRQPATLPMTSLSEVPSACIRTNSDRPSWGLNLSSAARKL